MNTELSSKEAKEILNLLKESNAAMAITPNLNTNRPVPLNLNMTKRAPKPQMAPAVSPEVKAPAPAPVQPSRGTVNLPGVPPIPAEGMNKKLVDLGGMARSVGDGINSAVESVARPVRNALSAITPSQSPYGSMAKMAPRPANPAMTPVGPFEKGPTPMAPQPQGSQSLSTAAITPVPVSRGVENPAMQMKAPTLADRNIAPAPQAAPAAPSFAGDVTDQERQLLRKLHASNFNPNSKRDQQMLEHLRSAGREAGGYDDFKTLRNLAYANQYGAKSDYGMLAQKWRDGRAQQVADAQGIPVKAGSEYTVLTRRNTGVTTTEGNVWINPADSQWLQKSAAYQDISWEDYCGLLPSDEPESVETFFNK